MKRASGEWLQDRKVRQVMTEMGSQRRPIMVWDGQSVLSVTQVNSIDGTPAASMVHQPFWSSCHDGICWAVLFNARKTADGKTAAGKIDPLVHRAANAVEEWPTHDLFKNSK